MRRIRPDADFAVCSNPEFLREGSAIQDFTHPDRVLVGIDDPRAREIMERIYEPLRLRNAPVMFVSRESAELAKYAANAFLARRSASSTRSPTFVEEVGANVQQVASAIGSDGRIGDKFLHPGPGYGGSCFPKDVSALARTAREARSPLTLIEQVEKVNNERKIAMAHKVIRSAGAIGGQDHRDLRRDLQAEHRRHARRAKPGDRADAAGARRNRPRLRSAGAKAGGTAPAACLVQERSRGRRRGRRRRRSDRMERVPCCEPVRAPRENAGERACGPSQHLIVRSMRGKRG